MSRAQRPDRTYPGRPRERWATSVTREIQLEEGFVSVDTTASAVRLVTALRSASAEWPDELWAGSVAWADGILRSYYGIYEFTDDPDCVLRVGLGQARAPVLLSDGTDLQLGELVGTLHFWNEHLPRYST